MHAYERTFPTYLGQRDAVRGIPYITIGDGGNREWFALPWNEPQPPWSALREDAFGFGARASGAALAGGCTYIYLFIPSTVRRTYSCIGYCYSVPTMYQKQGAGLFNSVGVIQVS